MQEHSKTTAGTLVGDESESETVSPKRTLVQFVVIVIVFGIAALFMFVGGR